MKYASFLYTVWTDARMKDELIICAFLQIGACLLSFLRAGVQDKQAHTRGQSHTRGSGLEPKPMAMTLHPSLMRAITAPPFAEADCP